MTRLTPEYQNLSDEGKIYRSHSALIGRKSPDLDASQYVFSKVDEEYQPKHDFQGLCEVSCDDWVGMSLHAIYEASEAVPLWPAYSYDSWVTAGSKYMFDSAS